MKNISSLTATVSLPPTSEQAGGEQRRRRPSFYLFNYLTLFPPSSRRDAGSSRLWKDGGSGRGSSTLCHFSFQLLFHSTSQFTKYFHVCSLTQKLETSSHFTDEETKGMSCCLHPDRSAVSARLCLKHMGSRLIYLRE